MDTLENLKRKMDGAADLKSVVRTMKALSASNLGQYKMAVTALEDYYHTIALGIIAYFKKDKIEPQIEKEVFYKKKERISCLIVFGSDQGLVGQFNDTMTDFVTKTLETIPGKKEVWAIGERIQLLLIDAGFTNTKLFPVPNSVHAISPLVGNILIKSEAMQEKMNVNEFYVFHNQMKPDGSYEPVFKRFLPLDKAWRDDLKQIHWPSKIVPQVAGGLKDTLSALIREYLFVSLFKSCAESLASENSSRLASMQRADKNIEELLSNLTHDYHSLRQTSIDEELFDIVSGFEALNAKPRNK